MDLDLSEDAEKSIRIIESISNIELINDCEHQINLTENGFINECPKCGELFFFNINEMFINSKPLKGKELKILKKTASRLISKNPTSLHKKSGGKNF